MAKEQQATRTMPGRLPRVEVPAETYQWNMRIKEPQPAEGIPLPWPTPPTGLGGYLLAAVAPTPILPNHNTADRPPSWAAIPASKPKRSFWGAAIALLVAIGIPFGANVIVRAGTISRDVSHRNWLLLGGMAAAYVLVGVATGILASEWRRQSTILRGIWATVLTAASGLLLLNVIRLHPIMFGWHINLVALVAIVPLVVPWVLAGGDRL